MKLKLEIETWNWNLKLKLKIETRNWNLKLNLEIETWNWTWNWNLKLKLEIKTSNWTWTLGLIMYTTRFSFGSKAPSLFEIGHNLGLFALFFLPLRAIFGVGVRFKNFFLTILYRQSTLVLKVQPYLLFTIRPYLGLLLDFFGPLGAFFGTFLGYFWGRGQVQKHFWNLLM